MKVSIRTAGVLVLFAFLTYGKPARAEAVLPTQFNAIFSMVENLILGENGVVANPISFSGCFVPPTLGFLTLNFHFLRSNTCSLSGDVTLGLIPLRASINLDVFNIPLLEAVQFDVVLSISIKNKITYTGMTISNGKMSIRPVVGGPLSYWALTGGGMKQKSKAAGVSGAFRINLFDESNLSGYAITKTILQQGSGPKTTAVQICSLAGADVQNYQTGTLSNCQ